jgi:hypothetical protein
MIYMVYNRDHNKGERKMNVINPNDIVDLAWENKKSGFIAGFAVGAITFALTQRKIRRMSRKMDKINDTLS